MNELTERVKSLFTSGDIDLFIGFEEGTRMPRPLIARSAEESEKLVFNNSCTGNLAVYLTRKELTDGNNVGVFASYYALKSICQLHDENQIREERLKVFAQVDSGFLLFKGINEIRAHLKTVSPPEKPDADELMKQIKAMSLTERWEFWSNELSKCFKCYACRAACPMCYCTKCIVEVNRPQWIQPWAATVANMEWQINRVMHMAGRCSDCGACGAACPLGLPIHILTHQMATAVKANFGEQSENGNVLSTFHPNDKETFIL